MKEKLLQEIYEQIEVPKEEVRDSIRKGILSTKTKDNKKVPLIRTLSVAAILFITTIITLGFSFPSLAGKLPVLNSIFNLFEDNVKEYIFNDHDRYTTKLDLVQESNGVRITLTDAVYDGENITIAYIIDSDHDLGEEPLIYSEPNSFKELYGLLSENQLIKKLDDHKYAGLSMLNILNGNRPDTIEFTWDATSIYSRFDNNIETKGNWSFKFTLDKVDSEVRQFKNVGTKGDGFEVKLKNITTTPISTSIYFIGKANIHSKEWIEENWITAFYDFEITDNLSNKYTVVSNSSYGGNIGGQHGRVITTEIDEDATSIIVTPIVTVFKEMKDQDPSEPGGGLEFAKPPFKLEPIKIPLK